VEDESKLCITYVKALQFNQVYMVLTYFTDAYADSLVLDNLMSAISPALVRHGLQPVYGFNRGDLIVGQ
jgi:predicted transglutaminase-like cysteine proteinase